MENFPNGQILLAGLITGMLHALEPDHIVMVSTLWVQSEQRRFARFFAWNIGHIGALLVMVGALIFFNALISDLWQSLFEFLIGVILAFAGGRILWRLQKTPLHMHAHFHARLETPHTHLHAHSDKHGSAHHQKKSLWPAWGIGILHGLAGSSVLAALLASGPVSGFRFPDFSMLMLWMSVFVLGMLASMGGLSFVLAFPARRMPETIRQYFHSGLQGLIGLGALIFGIAFAIRNFLS